MPICPLPTKALCLRVSQSSLRNTMFATNCFVLAVPFLKMWEKWQTNAIVINSFIGESTELDCIEDSVFLESIMMQQFVEFDPDS